jgi:hypothetical protein
MLTKMAKSDAEKQRDRRERMRAAGYVLRQLWVHPKDWDAVKKYVMRAMRKRGDSTED